MAKLSHFVALLIASIVISTKGAPAPQRFQAERFLDMLAKTFDGNIAYRDLLVALHKRLNLDPPNLASPNATASAVPEATAGSPTALEAAVNCPAVPPVEGTVVTYTSDPHVRGSRAFYQCEIGYTGQSKFVQCQENGQWSSSTGYTGCRPVDCGSPPPAIQHGTPALTATTYGSTASYSCEPGYKASTPEPSITCLASGKWDTPTFTCDKMTAVPQLDPANLGGLSSLFGGGQQAGASASGNPMLEALMKTMSSLGKGPGAQPAPTAASGGNNNNMLANFAKMFPNMMPSPPPTTTTPAPPTVNRNNGMPNGFQLPSHLQSLLPNGMSNTQGVNPNDLMALATAGLGSGSPGGAPRNLNQLFSSMNPLQALFGGAGMGGLGGAAPGGPGGAAGPGMTPDPEKAAEQREEMMMRAMMASAMKSMMSPRGNQAAGNSTGGAKPQSNSMDILALMALQNSLGGGAAGGAGGLMGGAGGMDPAMMMLGGMNPAMLGLGGGSGAGMFGGGGGGGLGNMFGSLGSLFGA